MKELVARVFQVLFIVLFLLVLLIGVPFAWILRDGLGPGSVESSGLEAVARCLMTFHVGPALGTLALLAIVASVICNARGESA